MGVNILRKELLEALANLEADDKPAAVQRLRQALRELEPQQLLTTTQAAELLGIRSVNTIKLWCRNGYLGCVERGGRTMIPVSEVERIQDDDRVRAVHAANALHDASAALGHPDGLSDEQSRGLIDSRPGTPPWRG